MKLVRQNQHNFPMIATFVKNNQIIAESYNKHKTHPLQNVWNKKVNRDVPFINLHAEIAAAITKTQNLVNSTLYVIRFNSYNELRCSLPCTICYPFLQHHGVKRIVCCDANRELVAININ